MPVFDNISFGKSFLEVKFIFTSHIQRPMEAKQKHLWRENKNWYTYQAYEEV